MVQTNELIVKTRFTFRVVCILVLLPVSWMSLAQDIPVVENFFPLPVGLSAEFEHENKIMEFTLTEGEFSDFTIFNRGNALLRVGEPNNDGQAMLVLEQPQTIVFPGLEQFPDASPISTYVLTQENNALELAQFEVVTDLGNRGTVTAQTTYDPPFPILTTLADCPNVADRREEYTLTERTTGSGMSEVREFSAVSFISTTSLPSFTVGSMSFQDVCLVEVRETRDEMNEPPVLIIGWYLAKGYGVVQIEQKFDNGSQFSRLTSTNITDFWTGSLTVNIAPEEAVNTEAQWKIIEVASGLESDFQNSGAKLDDLRQGQYDIVFKDIDGWNTPPTQRVTVLLDPEVATGTYTRTTSAISVVLNPPEAAVAGARWRIISEEFDSGFQVSDKLLDNVPVGNYTIQFSDILGWDSPNDMPITVVADAAVSDIGIYIRKTGSVSVTITPLEAIDAGAQWKIEGFESQYVDSGSILSDVPTGRYFLDLKDVPEWVVLNQAIDVVSNMTTELTVTYAADSDEDKMDDTWEVTNLGGTSAQPHFDRDGDGFSNVQEFRSGTDPLEYAIPLSHGWNLLSLSTVPNMNSLDSIFAQVDVYPIGWSYTEIGWEQTQALLDSFSAYWAYQRGPADTVSISSETLEIDDETSLFEISLETGWNLISIKRVPDDNSVAAMFNGVNISLPVWKWQNNRFVVAKNIEPLLGYWVYLNGSSIKVPVFVTVQESR